MWTFIIIALALAVLVAFTWGRQIRHKQVATGRSIDRESLLAQKGQYLGHGGMGGG